MKKVMKRIANAIMAFWYFKVRNFTRRVVTLGGFKIRFREYDMTIKSLSDNFKMTVRADCHPFGYLSASLAKGKNENIQGYATIMYLVATGITTDEKLNNEIRRALMRYNDRLEAKAAMNVKNESANDAEIAHKANIEAVKAEMPQRKLSRAERREKEREMRKIIRKEYGKGNE